MADTWDPRPLREFLETLMERNGWNQTELARHMKVSGSALGRWLSGENQPAPDKLRQAARSLRVDYDELLVRAGYRSTGSEPKSGRHADLCAKLSTIPLTDLQYRLLDGVLDALIADEHPLAGKPTA